MLIMHVGRRQKQINSLHTVAIKHQNRIKESDHESEQACGVIYASCVILKTGFGTMVRGLGAMAEHCSSPRVLELHEGERRSSSSIFQIDVSNRSVFVEQVFDILGADIRGEISHVNAAVIVSRGSSEPTA